MSDILGSCGGLRYMYGDEIFPVVGVGASAGGLDALKAFARATAPQTGAAYVVLQHLPPNQPSSLSELLQAETSLPVRAAADGDTLQPNHLYVVPPGTVATLEGDTLRLSQYSKPEERQHPLDILFTSLAARGASAICVVLSGSGHDGAEGLVRIKAAGGLALAQDSAEAQFSSMPASAIATGMVDYILPASQIATYVEEALGNSTEGLTTADIANEDIERALPELTARLAEITGNDFSSYKPGTLVRRIKRRMHLLRISDVTDLQTILQDEQQALLLAQEFLIGVTSFFRDPEAFEALRKLVITPRLESSEDTLRIWVPGCSTGEEAYSVAMLCIEEMEARGDPRVLQVFGTDINAAALLAARAGIFGPSAIDSLSADRKARFFQFENGLYRATPQLREVCIFAPHNLLQDPPFSRLDLICCRNMLIYFDSQLQKQVIPKLHFALKPGGHLFLGPSEGLAGQDAFFDVCDKRHRIYQRNNDAKTTFSSTQDIRRKSGQKLSFQPAALHPSPKYDLSQESLAEAEFLRSFAAPFALVSGFGEVLYTSQNMSGLIQPSHGVPSNLIDTYLAPELRQPVRSCLNTAQETNTVQQRKSVVVASGANTTIYDVKVAPAGTEFLLILAEVRVSDMQELAILMQQNEVSDKTALELENIKLRKQLANTMAEFDAKGQELMSMNEELMSMNEELQSTNEELEASRESLQTSNEDLEALNAELENLYDTTPVGLSLVDRDLRFLRMNKSLAKINGFERRDHIGKTIKQLLPDLDPKLVEIYDKVFTTGQAVRDIKISGITEAAPGKTRHWMTDYYPVWKRQQVVAAGSCVREITDQVELLEHVQGQNEHQKLLMAELQHRVKNTLAIISSISKLLLKDVDDPRVYQKRLENRLDAISRTHDLLTSSNWTKASLAEIIANEAAPFEGDKEKRVVLSGPDLMLSAEHALSMGMGIHELMTNAAKYGALSSEQGLVTIQTDVTHDGPGRIAHIAWSEKDGPEILAKPDHKGFGSLVLERVLERDLGGSVSVSYRPEGLSFELEFELTEDPPQTKFTPLATETA
ncbi:chemotaxis protein CheB [Lentibacter sp.]|uniref:chemotaxis protein CheB n=1 Tax=Lentibacter sp. TaxID=2024994 RepID=UPI003F6AE381